MTYWTNAAQARLRPQRPVIEPELLEEPDVDEMLDDPVMQALMRRDGVTRKQLTTLILNFRLRRARPKD